MQGFGGHETTHFVTVGKKLDNFLSCRHFKISIADWADASISLFSHTTKTSFTGI